MNQVKLSALTAALLAASSVTTSQAAPLPQGAALSITPGVVSNGQCASGSCFLMELSGFLVWAPITPGTDGGLIIGKNQLPGGQQTGSSPGNTTPGEVTAAWSFFGNYGTFATAPFTGVYGSVTTDATANVFDQASCTTSLACLGKTTLGTWHLAWNGVAAPFGSAGGCKALDPIKCVGIYNWSLNPSPVTDGSTYVLDYTWAVPNGDPSGFGNVPLWLHLTGNVSLPDNRPPVAGDLSLDVDYDRTATWYPRVSDPDLDTLTCRIGTPALHGTASVAGDCSSGSYTPEAGYIGNDSFTYIVSDGQLESAPGTVSVSVGCTHRYPIVQITTVGSGQEPTVNATLWYAFTGHIIRYTDRSVTICNRTTLQFETFTTVGTPNCAISGFSWLAPGALMVCTNKPTGQDTDRFRILGQY